ncbi:MAG: N-acetylmuramoyl-L-alanine amidase [Alphaproteobacteria bacterium]|jgi:N-acetylmuramoyl-L-alanine amidase|nr:N-acetylmuramoyl-L-alanine amidase [Candidatus Jidaibacter sp.]
MQSINYPSVNYSDRKKSAVIDTIVIHHTATNDLETALKILTQNQYQVSSHYVIDKDGSVYYLVHENKKAWHAGISSWRGREGMNDYSIGIELVNNGFQAFPEKQMDALIELCLGIMDRHNIDQRNVIGHFDVAPKRKIDPNEFFDWKKLFENGIGLYSTLSSDSQDVLYYIGDRSEFVSDVRNRLGEFGYKISGNDLYDAELNAVIMAFKRHYSIETYGIYGWDVLADARLNDIMESYV